MADGRQRLEDRADEWLDRQAGALADKPRRTIGKAAALVVAAVLLIVVAFSVLGWVGSWGGEAKRVASPDNVRAQYAVVIGDWQAMEAAAGNACQAKTSNGGSDDPTLVESPDFAYAAQFRKIAADYNAHQADIFKARLVGPKGYPRTAPTLGQMQKQVC